MARNQLFPKIPGRPAGLEHMRGHRSGGEKKNPRRSGGLLYRQWPGTYSALPPNLWVYCRLMVRPTLSNQDTS